MSAVGNATPTTALPELAAWCRRDRGPRRFHLAAAGGDPVALTLLGSDLATPERCRDPAAAVEIVAARRPDRLTGAASGWPDDEAALQHAAMVSAWVAALRHLHASGSIDPAAASVRGPLRAEAEVVGIIDIPPIQPFVWRSFCDQASRRRFVDEELRAVARIGFVEPHLDVGTLAGLDPMLLRSIRGRWADADGLMTTLAHCDLGSATPLGLALWWEAACHARLDDREVTFVDALAGHIGRDDEPDRWWPAVLAGLTDWVAP